jgi:hypothetical protein
VKAEVRPPEHYNCLRAVKEEAFALLTAGVTDRRSFFHTPAFVTLGLDGFPSARTVVLRGFDSGSLVIVVHTDHRSRKVTELSADNRAAAMVYDQKMKVQVRLAGLCTVHHGDQIALRAWRRLPVSSRRVYLGAAPGAMSGDATSGLPASLETQAPSIGDSEFGFANFAVIHMRLHTLDWLYLRARGNRRARLTWAEGGDGETRTWLAP